MKNLLLLLLLAGSAYADGPLFRYKETDTDQEFQNAYQSVRNPSIDYGTAKILNITSSTIRSLSISTVTITSATITAGTITTATISTATITNLRGVTDGSDACTGCVGAYVQSATTSDLSAAATTVYDDLLSIALTAGDWDVTGQIYWDINNAGWAQVRGGISNTTGNDGTGLNAGSSLVIMAWASSTSTPQTIPLTIPVLRVSLLTGTTTYYLKRRSTFTSGTPITRGGLLSARRVR